MTFVALAARTSRAAFLFGIVSLAWIGVGLVHLTTGRDLGSGLQPAYLAFALAFVCGLADPAFRRRLLRLPPDRWLWSAALIAVLVSWFGMRSEEIGIPASVARLRFLKQIIQWLVMVIIAMVTWAHLREQRDWRHLRMALALGLALQFLYGLLQILAFGRDCTLLASAERIFTSNPSVLAGSEELYLGHGFSGIPRVRGTACEPLYLASFVLALTPWFVAWGFRARRWLGIAGLGVVLLLATWSRGAWLAAAVAAALGAWLAWKAGARPRRRDAWTAVIAVVLGLLLLIIVFGADNALLPVQRLAQAGSLWDWSNLTRVYSMQTAWRAFLSEPLFGVGWGQFAYNFYVLVEIEGLQSQFDWPVVNNVPLLILAETGLLGCSVFLAACGILLLRTKRRLALVTRGAVLDEGTLHVMAAWVAFTGVGLQLLTFSQYNLPHLWVALGMGLAALYDDASSAKGEGR